ncbi:MAG: SBBP repeat-containing protein [Bacteroidetes bacterium]|nr:SBBP repeat-containing protein [Bacteroidota bacterium]
MRVNLKYYCGCLVLIIWIFCFPTNANAQTFQWAAGSGGILEDIGLGMAVDYNGNSYFTGVFEGTADFDPGPGSFYMSVVAPYTHVFIVKLDSSGNFLWAKQLDGNMSGKGASIAVDSSANAYITGYFIGSGDFNPGAGVFNLVSNGTSNGDIFILKLDTNGDFIWVKQIGSTEDDQGQSIALDLNQNIYVTGYFNNSADFNPGTGVFFLTSAGNSDIFILKLDTDGNFIFALKFGGISTDSGNEIKISASGNVYTTGHFASVADFDPGPGIFNLTCGGLYDAFILKINADGNFVWAKGLGGISYDWGYSLDIDSQENVYTVGEFRDSVDVDPGPGVSNIVPVGTGKHIFSSKLDSAGNLFWKGILGSTFL